MNLLLVTFSLRDKNKNYDSFFVALRGNSLNWLHYIEQTCLVSTVLDADTFAKKLLPYIQRTDSLIVAQLEPHKFQGWLPLDAWNWLNDVSSQIQRERRGSLPLSSLPPPPELLK
jgi:hypothetical protein